MGGLKNVCIELGERSYLIFISDNILAGDADSIDFSEFRSRSACIVTNETVAPFYESTLIDLIKKDFSSVFSVRLRDGEAYKNFDSLQIIYDALLRNGSDRKTVIFALGGGVVGDMAGFVAATFMRGIPFVQVPTTLLSQVDSSVGGKTGINHPLGKNMIGAFYQPKMVLCDTSTLKTLPDRELSAGLAEVIKYGPIADMEFMTWLEGSIDLLRQKDPKALVHAIKRSCEIKAWVVAQDERENGLRAILNFGHTFGHAIEAGMGYGVWLHGEGVAAGMVMAAELSLGLGLVEESFVQRLRALIARAGLPVVGPILNVKDNAGRYLELMQVDKKSEAGEIRYIVIDGPGKARLQQAPESLVRDVINRCCKV